MIYVSGNAILEYVKRLLQLRQPTLCRHAFACDLLSLLIECGWDCPNSLAENVVRANDENALEILEKIIKKNKE